MALSNDEMIQALTLNETQAKAFAKLEKAYSACVKAGIVFVSFEEFHHAINGSQLVGHDSNLLRDIRENEVELGEVDAPYFIMEESYASSLVFLEVRE